MLTEDYEDAVGAVRRLDIDSRLAIRNAAAQFCLVIEANFTLDKDRVENLAIDFAYRLFIAQQDR